MAKAILEQLLKERGLTASVISAGTDALAGDAASPHAVEVMREQGLDLSGHAAVRLTAALVEQADLILTMSERHKEVVRSIDPQAIEKTFALKEFVGESGDVTDPFGQDVETYRKTAAALRELLAKAVERIPIFRARK